MRTLIAFSLLTLCFAITNCKGYREFGEARKELKEEKAERRAQREAEEANESQANAQPPASPTSEKEERFPDSLFFAMAKTPCFGRCPTYEVKLYQSGYATYHGKAHVERIGHFETHYDTAYIDTISQWAQDIGIMMLLDSYDNSMISDLPSTIIQIQIGTQKKEVLCRVNCPERLVDFSNKVERLIEQINLKKAAY